MGLKVVGAGLGRTGTASLKMALEELLGGRCHHMFEVDAPQIPIWTQAAHEQMPDWQDFLKDYIALVDWPGASFWPELAEIFPDALVLLSVRDLDEWYNSAKDTIFRPCDYEQVETDKNYMWLEILRTRFCDELDNPDKMIAAAKAHNERVIATIPGERLLVWMTTDGWEPICNALGLPVPDKPFPRQNSKQVE